MKTFTLPNSLLKSLCFTLLLTGFSLAGFAQMKIGNNPTQIHKSSILELESDQQGLLLTRIDDWSGINTILGTDDVNGLIVYYTDAANSGQDAGLYMRKDGDWVKIASASDAANNWSLKGNAGTDSTVNFLGTTDEQALSIVANNKEAIHITKDGFLELPNIPSTTDSFSVLVIDPLNGNIIKQKALSTAAFENAIRFLNGLKNEGITLKADSSETDPSLGFTANAADSTVNLSIPMVNNTTKIAGLLSYDDYVRFGKAAVDWTPAFSTTADADGISIDNDTHVVTLHAADATNPGGVSAGTQTFGGDKIFDGNVTASNQLNVNGVASLNGGATVSTTSTTNPALAVNGSTTISGDATVDGNTVLGSNTSGTVTIKNLQPYGGAAPVTALVVDGSNQVQTYSLSTDAGKELVLDDDGQYKNVHLEKTATQMTLSVPDATADTRGVVNHDAQTFGGDKTFSDDVTVTGATTLNDAATLNNTLDVKGDATLEQTVTLSTEPTTVTTPTTDFKVLTRNFGTGAIEQTTISADAGKSIELGNTPVADPINGTDASNNPIKGLHIDKTTDPTKITLQVPDADADVRGVVNTTNQTIGGKKTFADNTTIGTPTTSANLTVNGGIAARTIEINAGETLSGDHAMARTILIDADAGTGNVTIKLPTDPEDGRIYTFRIVANTNLAHDITIDANGKQFGDSTPTEPHTSMTFWNAGSSRTIQFKDDKWYIISQ